MIKGMFDIKELPRHIPAILGIWDDFVEACPQGTIFSTTKWLNLFNAPYHIFYICSGGTGDKWLGGIACFDTSQPITPFQGILVRETMGKYVSTMSLHNKVAKALMPCLPDEFCNHYTFPDIRPFLWAGWQAYIRYTYVVKPDWSELEKDTRNEIRKGAQAERSNDIEAFDSLYEKTFTRKGLPRTASSELVRNVFKLSGTELYLAKDKSAGAMLIKDSKRWYYILGASEGTGSASVVWEAIKDKNEVDMVGCNNEKIGLFKRGFGGKLVAYYGVKRL